MPDEIPKVFAPAEDCPCGTPREILGREGYTPLPPSELDDRQLPGRLWEWLYAAAARRFYFSSSNHLNERDFYTLLWEQWLDHPTADIPFEAETHTQLIMSEFNAGDLNSEEIWLRYYADDKDRALWQKDEPDFVFPAHQDPPFDRDRFLPVPPIPLEAHSGWLPGDDEPLEETSEADPLGLAEIDRQIADAQGESGAEDSFSNPPSTELEAQLAASEPENWTPPAQQLAEQNIPLLPPAEITEETLTPILWELLHNLALRGFYVLHTDHLSDRDLYVELWQKGLRDPAHLPGRNPHGGWFHDFLGSWGDEQMQWWLRYYASDDERAKHAKEWPKDTLPPKENRPFHRDWRLPKGPF